MNVLMVRNRWEAPILDGSKDTTIRPHRKDGKPRAKPGQELSIRVWTGKPYRSKQREICRRFVKFVFPVRITSRSIHRPDIKSNLSRMKVAKADGFQNWIEMREFFRVMHGLPFEGVLIHWELKS